MKRAYRHPLLAHWLFYIPLGLVLIFASTIPVRAQFTTARLGGTVSDLSGAVVAGATITVQDLGTGYSQTTNSSPAGQYLFPSLPVGAYQITVSMAGYSQVCPEGHRLIRRSGGDPGCPTASGLGFRTGCRDRKFVSGYHGLRHGWPVDQ